MFSPLVGQTVNQKQRFPVTQGYNVTFALDTLVVETHLQNLRLVRQFSYYGALLLLVFVICFAPLNQVYAQTLPGIEINHVLAQTYFQDDGVEIAEGAAIGDRFAIRLTQPPTGGASVQVTLTGSREVQFIREPRGRSSTSLAINFSSSRNNLNNATLPWDEWFYVNVTSPEDDIVEGAESQSITFTFRGANNYAHVTVPPLTVTVYDKGIILDPVLLEIQEGDVSSYSVQVTAPPGMDLGDTTPHTTTVALSGFNAAYFSELPSSLAFTRNNWKIPQVVTVQTVEDFVDNPDPYTTTIAHTISTNHTNSNASRRPPAAQLPITIVDNDSAGVFTDSSSELVTNEAGGTATFTVVLNSQPTADVALHLSSNDPSEGLVSPTDLFFNTVNWNIAQTVTATGADDVLEDGTVDYAVLMQVSSDDTKYNALNMPLVPIRSLDNEGASDIALSGGFSPSTIRLYEATVFTLNVTNQGPTQGSNIVIDTGLTAADLVWSGYETYSFSDGSEPAIFDTEMGVLSIPILLVGSFVQLDVSLQPYPSIFNVTSTWVSAGEPEVGIASNTLFSTLTVYDEVDIYVGYYWSENPTSVGESVRMHGYIMNWSWAEATNVVFQVNAEGLTFEAFSPSEGSYATYDASTGELRVPSITGWGSVYFDLDFVADEVGSYPISVSYISSDQGDNNSWNDSASYPLDVVDTVDICINCPEYSYFSPNPVGLGDESTFVLFVANEGPVNTATNVVVDTGLLASDLLEGYQSHSVTEESQPATFDPITGMLSIPALDQGKYVRLEVTILPPVGIHSVTTSLVSVTQPEMNDWNNASAYALTVENEVEIYLHSLAFSENPTGINEPIAINFCVGNDRARTATNIVLDTSLETFNNFVFVSARTNSGSEGVYDAVTGRLSISSLPRYASSCQELTYTTASTGDYTITVDYESSEQPDSYSGNNHIESTLHVVDTVDLGFDWWNATSFDPSAIGLNETTTYNLSIRNFGPTDTTNVTFDLGFSASQLLTAVVSYSLSGTAAAEFDPTGGLLTVASFPDDSFVYLQVTLLPTMGGTYNNTASLIASTPQDTTPSNNTSAAQLRVYNEIDVSVSGSWLKNPTAVDQPVIYQICLNNSSVLNATNVVVDTNIEMKGSLIVSSIAPSPGHYLAGSYNNATGELTVPSLPRYTWTCFDVNLTPTAASYYTVNSRFVRADQTDTNLLNNFDSDNLRVVDWGDLSLWGRWEAATIAPDSSVYFTLNVQNYGPRDMTHIVIDTNLGDTALGYLLHTISGATDANLDPVTGRLIIEALPNGEMISLSILFQPALGAYTTTASFNQADQPEAGGPNTFYPNTFTDELLVTGDADVDLYSAGWSVYGDVIPNQPITFNLNVRNNSPIPATNVVIDTGLSAVFTPDQIGSYASDWPDSTFDETTGLITIPNLQFDPFYFGRSFRVSVTPPNNGTYAITSTLTSLTESESPTSNNSITTTLLVDNEIDLSINMDETGWQPPNIPTGNYSSYTLTVSNLDPSQTATNIHVRTDAVKAGLAYVTSVIDPWWYCYSCTYDPATSEFVIPYLWPGNSIRLRLTVRGDVEGTYTTTSAIISSAASDPNPENDTDNDTLVVGGRNVDVSVFADWQTNPVGPGEIVAYILQASNIGSENVTNVVIHTDVIQPGILDYNSHSIDEWGGFDAAIFDPLTGNLTIGTLPVGGYVYARIFMTTGGVGTFPATAALDTSALGQPDGNPNNNVSNSLLTVTNTIDIEMSAGYLQPNPTYSDQEVTFEFSISNRGPATATGVRFDLPFPIGLTYIGYSLSGSAGTYDPTTGLLYIESIRAYSGIYLSITVRTSTVGSYLMTAAFLDANQVETDLSDNSAFITLNVVSGPDIAITNAHWSPTSIAVGGSSQYTFSIVNEAGLRVTNLVVSTGFPISGIVVNGTSFLNLGMDYTYDSATGTLTIPSLPLMVPYLEFTMVVTANAQGTYTPLTTLVSMDNGDSDSGDTTTSAALTVGTGTFDLQMSYAVWNAAQGVQGNSNSLNLQLCNVGQADGTNVLVNLIATSGTDVQYLSHSSWYVPLAYDPVENTLFIPFMPAKQCQGVVISVNMNTAGTYAEMGASLISADQPDANPYNNSINFPLQVVAPVAPQAPAVEALPTETTPTFEPTPIDIPSIEVPPTETPAMAAPAPTDLPSTEQPPIETPTEASPES